MSRAALIAAVCALAAVLSWAVASADDPLSIVLQAPSSCEADFDEGNVAPSLNVEWQVTGGSAPYQILVDGERYEGATGVAKIICGVWSNEGRYISDVDSGQMAILARVTDATGESASATAHIYAVRVIRVVHTDNIVLARGQTYRVYGLLLTMPDEFDARLRDYVSSDCSNGVAACEDHFILFGGVGGEVSPTEYVSVQYSIALQRWSATEHWRSVWPGYADETRESGLVASTNDALDRLVASLGKPRATLQRSESASASDATDLRITLFAPAICETYGGRYGAERQSVEVEWQVTGGTGPYRVQFAEETLDGAYGVITLLCGKVGTDRSGVDSQLMTTQAIVTDSAGATASGVVNTYAIASRSYGDSRLRGGWTHRMEGLLITIPEELEFDVSSIWIAEVQCGAGSCTHAGCLDSGMPVCENSWTMQTTGGSVFATFGEVTKEMFDRRINEEDLADDPGVGVETATEVERLLDELVASIGEPPQLPEDGVFNSAPLRIVAWAAPIGCTSAYFTGGWRWASAQRRVSGGYWWPLDVGNEVGDGQTRDRARLRCPTTWGWYSQELQVREGGPSPASAETTVSHFTPPEVGDGVLIVRSGSSATASTYCQPGGSRRVWFFVRGGAGPYRATLNGVDLEVDHDPLYPDNGNGGATAACADTVGLQAVTLEVWDSSDPAHYTAHPIILSVVEEHPSGQPWSDFD